MTGYKHFIERVSEEYEIIIGIDELDKLESDKAAQRFLNEIKGLFGLHRCFYLISVSESAMSSFERRGLPFRDVFDSSFDAIIHVDYLDLNGAQRLLKGRVIGVPNPFLDLCYCMAGGLPRDLIRTFRDLLQHSQSDTGNNLSQLCTSLIKSDLKAKLRAVNIAAKEVQPKARAIQLFNRIERLRSALDSECLPGEERSILLQECRDLLENMQSDSARLAEPSENANESERVDSLGAELDVYLYYCMTLLDFFSEKVLSETTLREVESSGALTRLARARQLLASSPDLASSAISHFRSTTQSMNVPLAPL